MARSLTVLLPVRNVQSTLAATVSEVLEVVSELTDRFELVIVDDGSADATSEVAQELTRRYPQVRAVCPGQSVGREAAVEAGLKHCRGEIVFLRDEASGLALDGLPKLWQAANEHPLPPGPAKDPGSQRRPRSHAQQRTDRAGYRMIDPRAMPPSRGSSRPTRPNYLARLKKFALDE